MASACSDSDDRDDAGQTDAGQTDAGQTDAGQTDAGQECPLQTDCSIPACESRACGNGGICTGGSCVEPTEIGDDCSGPTAAKPQGTCTGDQQVCNNDEYLITSGKDAAPNAHLTCSRGCTSAADCGQTNGNNNTCVRPDPNSEGYCIKGCSTADDCGEGNTCGQTASGNRCVVACTANSECLFGLTCTDPGLGTKTCYPVACPAAATCGDGRVCQPIGQQNLCVDKCSATNPCQGGLECDEADGICKPHAGTYYQPCSATVQCTAETDAICVRLGTADGNCMQNCTQTGACGDGDPAGTKCEVVLKFQGDNPPPDVRICALPCVAGTTECPQGTTCQAPGGATSTYCLPSAPAP